MAPAGRSLLRLSDVAGHPGGAVAYTDWGGYALAPYAVQTLPPAHTRWVLDPFRFLATALNLPPMPVPDTSTESGRRLLFAQLRAESLDGRAELPNTPPAAVALYAQILTRYPVPTAVALSADDSRRPLPAHLRTIAARILALPHVEPAGGLPPTADLEERSTADPREAECGLPGGRSAAGKVCRLPLLPWDAGLTESGLPGIDPGTDPN